MNSSPQTPDPQHSSSASSAASNSVPSKPDDYNPHEKSLTRRDITFLCYMAALGVVPLIAALVLCYVLYAYYPNFDSFPRGAAPMGVVDENARVMFPEETPKSPAPESGSTTVE